MPTRLARASVDGRTPLPRLERAVVPIRVRRGSSGRGRGCSRSAGGATDRSESSKHRPRREPPGPGGVVSARETPRPSEGSGGRRWRRVAGLPCNSPCPAARRQRRPPEPARRGPVRLLPRPSGAPLGPRMRRATIYPFDPELVIRPEVLRERALPAHLALLEVGEEARRVEQAEVAQGGVQALGVARGEAELGHERGAD